MKFLWQTTLGGFHRFLRIGGSNYAAAFAFYAFFSLFPLMLLVVSMASLVIDDRVEAVEAAVGLLDRNLPLDEEQREQFLASVRSALAAGLDTLARASFWATLLGGLALLWSSLKFFKALVTAQNRAWQCAEGAKWWQIPAKTGLMLGVVGGALLLGLLVPFLIDAVVRFLPEGWEAVRSYLRLGKNYVALLILAYGLFFFYRFCPGTRVRTVEVVVPTILVVLALSLARSLFIWAIHLVVKSPGAAVYDTIAVWISVMYSIYFGGCLIILGSCIAAASARKRPKESGEKGVQK